MRRPPRAVMPAAGSSSRIEVGLARPAPWRARPIGAGHGPAGRRCVGDAGRCRPAQHRRRRRAGRRCAPDATWLAASQMFSRTRQAVEDAGHLGLDADAAAARSRGLRMPVIVLAAEQDVAGGRLELAGQQLEERALAGAVGPIRQRSSPSASVKSTPSHRLDAAEAHASDRRGLEQRRVIGAASARWAAARPPARPARRRRASASARRRHQRRQASGTTQHEDHRGSAQHAGQDRPSRAALSWFGAERRWSATGCRMQPMTGPISVPSPPTMTQMMICAAGPGRTWSGLTKRPSWRTGSRRGRPCAPPIVKMRELVEARVVAQQLGARLVLADRDDDAAEAGWPAAAQAEIDEQQQADRRLEHVLGRRAGRRLSPGKLSGRRSPGMPLKPPSGASPMRVLRRRRWVDEAEEDQRHGQRDDAEIDVADAAVEHEVAEQRGEQRRHQRWPAATAPWCRRC